MARRQLSGAERIAVDEVAEDLVVGFCAELLGKQEDGFTDDQRAIRLRPAGVLKRRGDVIRERSLAVEQADRDDTVRLRRLATGTPTHWWSRRLLLHGWDQRVGGDAHPCKRLFFQCLRERFASAMVPSRVVATRPDWILTTNYTGQPLDVFEERTE